MNTIKIRIEGTTATGDTLYQETVLDQSLYSDAMLLELYSKLAADFAAFAKLNP